MSFSNRSTVASHHIGSIGKTDWSKLMLNWNQGSHYIRKMDLGDKNVRIFCATDTQLTIFAESVITTDEKLDNLQLKIEDCLRGSSRDDRLKNSLKFRDPMKRESRRLS